jgi:hypothetical protein
LKFLNELAASNDRNFKFTALVNHNAGALRRDSWPVGGLIPVTSSQ